MASPAERNAKANWTGWIRYFEHYAPDGRRDKPLSQAAVARLLGISPSGLNQQMNDPDRLPSFELLLATKRVTGWPLDQILLIAPPRT